MFDKMDLIKKEELTFASSSFSATSPPPSSSSPVHSMEDGSVQGVQTVQGKIDSFYIFIMIYFSKNFCLILLYLPCTPCTEVYKQGRVAPTGATLPCYCPLRALCIQENCAAAFGSPPSSLPCMGGGKRPVRAACRSEAPSWGRLFNQAGEEYFVIQGLASGWISDNFIICNSISRF